MTSIVKINPHCSVTQFNEYLEWVRQDEKIVYDIPYDFGEPGGDIDEIVFEDESDALAFKLRFEL